MSQPTYLFYDLETTGLNPCFDQVVQFAAIRTDLQFNELAQHEINIKLNCDVIPSIYALFTHGINTFTDVGKSTEIEAIQQIHALLNTPNTRSLGYNTLGFDDEFLRFSFYKNLLPPYTHQYAHQCSRMDIYPLTTAYYLYKPNIIKWPLIEKKVSLKLANISLLNQLAKGNAHDAMVDVKATLALAKCLATEHEMWDYLAGYFDKNIDTARLQQLPTALTHQQTPYRQALLILGKLGAKQNFIAPVLHLGQHKFYKNQSIWLRLDNPELPQVKTDNIDKLTFSINKKPGDQHLLLPTHARFLDKLTTTRQQLAQDNIKWLQNNPSTFDLICDYHLTYQYPQIDHVDVDAALYQTGFSSSQETQLYKNFHQRKPMEKLAIAEQFQQPHAKEQALRIMGRHFKDYLTTSQQREFDEYLQTIYTNTGRLIDYKGQRKLTKQMALEEITIATQQNRLTAKQAELVHQFKNYLEQLDITNTSN